MSDPGWCWHAHYLQTDWLFYLGTDSSFCNDVAALMKDSRAAVLSESLFAGALWAFSLMHWFSFPVSKGLKGTAAVCLIQPVNKSWLAESGVLAQDYKQNWKALL